MQSGSLSILLTFPSLQRGPGWSTGLQQPALKTNLRLQALYLMGTEELSQSSNGTRPLVVTFLNDLLFSQLLRTLAVLIRACQTLLVG